MSKWPETPHTTRIRARLIDDRIVDYKDLRKGDIFQALDPNGAVIDPITAEPDDVWAIACGDPIPNDACGRGYALMMESGSLEDVRRKAN